MNVQFKTMSIVSKSPTFHHMLQLGACLFYLTCRGLGSVIALHAEIAFSPTKLPENQFYYTFITQFILINFSLILGAKTRDTYCVFLDTKIHANLSFNHEKHLRLKSFGHLALTDINCAKGGQQKFIRDETLPKIQSVLVHVILELCILRNKGTFRFFFIFKHLVRKIFTQINCVLFLIKLNNRKILHNFFHYE